MRAIYGKLHKLLVHKFGQPYKNRSKAGVLFVLGGLFFLFLSYLGYMFVSLSSDRLYFFIPLTIAIFTISLGVSLNKGFARPLYCYLPFAFLFLLGIWMISNDPYLVRNQFDYYKMVGFMYACFILFAFLHIWMFPSRSNFR